MLTAEQLQNLAVLREGIRERISAKRFFHTVEVEKTAEILAELYLPEEIYNLRAAALLHDITKEVEVSEQISLLEKFGETATFDNISAPKTLHARTAALLIPVLCPEFDRELIISAVRWHTTGRAEMTLAEKLIYLADYIDMSRRFESCVILRNFFFDAKPDSMDMPERLSHLDATLLKSFDLTIADILHEGKVICPDTVSARNWLITVRK